MRDTSGNAYERARQALETLRLYLGENGYEPIDTPLLEETELFVRKSGGELAGRLYTFTDPGGYSVSLRPEFTSSVIRHFIHERQSLNVPVRWQYSGPVFRYEQEGSDGYRQFTQVGAELVGAGGLDADAEVVSLAWRGLERIGLSDYQLKIGHLGVLHDLLNSFELSESAKLFIIGNIQALKSQAIDTASLVERAREVGLLRGSLDLGIETALEDMSREAAQGFIRSVLRESMPTPMGRRTADQIVARLLEKASSANDPAEFESALALVDALSRLEGFAEDVLTQAKRVVSNRGLRTAPLENLQSLFERLSARHIPESRMVLDMGLARGISYYTGVIFEFMLASSDAFSLGGGGRYDGLVRALGGDQDVPAMGFAYYLDSIIDVLVSMEKSLVKS